MARSAALLAIGADLKAASAACDWERLAALATALPARLAALAAAGPLAPAERRALAQLRSAYDQAEAACGQAARDVGARLDEMHNNKEGWMAYALDGDAEPATDLP
jgi:hypothetical protein